MDCFFASLIFAWLSIQLDGTIAARDCLQCWRDVCGPGFSPDTSFSSDCCDCIDMQGECIANAVSVSPSSDCCSIAETNLLSVFTLDSGEQSAACTDSHVFNSPEQLRVAVDTANTLQPGAYIIPSFTFDCSGCIKEVLVRGLITLPGFIAETDIITIGLQIWSHFDPPSDQNDLHKMIHNVSISNTDIEADNLLPELFTITFNLSESNQICFNDGEVLGLTVDESEGLNILLENRDNQRVYDVSSSSSATCSNLDDLVILTPETQSYSGVPLVAINIIPPIVFTSAEIVPATSSIDIPRSTIRIGTLSSTIFQTRTRSIDGYGTLPTIKPRNVTESHALPMYIIYVSVGASAAVVVLIAAAVTVISVSVYLKKRKNKHVNTTDNVAYHDSSGQVTMESNKAYQYTTTDPATTAVTSANIAYNVIRREGPHEYEAISFDLTVDTTPAYQAIADVQSTLQDEEYAYAYESVPTTAETDMGITTTPNEVYATNSAPQHESISEN